MSTFGLNNRHSHSHRYKHNTMSIPENTDDPLEFEDVEISDSDNDDRNNKKYSRYKIEENVKSGSVTRNYGKNDDDDDNGDDHQRNNYSDPIEVEVDSGSNSGDSVSLTVTACLVCYKNIVICQLPKQKDTQHGNGIAIGKKGTRNRKTQKNSDSDDPEMTHNRNEDTLHCFSKLFKISSTIFQDIVLSSLAGPRKIFCSLCHSKILYGMEILREIEKLQTKLNTITKEIKKDLLESYASHPEGSQSQVKHSSVESNSCSVELCKIKDQIRKSFVQCWTKCFVPFRFSHTFQCGKKDTTTPDSANCTCRRQPLLRTPKSSERQILPENPDPDHDVDDNFSIEHDAESFNQSLKITPVEATKNLRLLDSDTIPVENVVELESESNFGRINFDDDDGPGHQEYLDSDNETGQSSDSVVSNKNNLPSKGLKRKGSKYETEEGSRSLYESDEDYNAADDDGNEDDSDDNNDELETEHSDNDKGKDESEPKTKRIKKSTGISKPKYCTSFKCKFCSHIFQKEDYKSDTGEYIFKCTLFDCKVSKPFNTFRELKRHHMMVCKLKPGYMCKHCGREYAQSTNLRYHVIECHPETISEVSKDKDIEESKSSTNFNSNSNPNPGLNRILLTFQCEFCKRVFNRDDFRQNDSNTDNDNDTGQSAGDKYIFLCDIPNCLTKKPFRTLALLKRHHKTTCLDRPAFPCEQCDKVCTSSRALEDHIVISHTNDFKFTCHICGSLWPTARRLNEHMGRHRNLAARKYVCPKPDCSKAFPKKSDLDTHITRHGVRNQILCETCGKGFANRKDLQKHAGIHGSEKKYQCKLCDKAFMTSTYLSSHVWATHKKMRKANTKRSSIKEVRAEVKKRSAKNTSRSVSKKGNSGRKRASPGRKNRKRNEEAEADISIDKTETCNGKTEQSESESEIAVSNIVTLNYC